MWNRSNKGPVNQHSKKGSPPERNLTLRGKKRKQRVVTEKNITEIIKLAYHKLQRSTK